jgi:hypothetical protein
VRRVKIQRFIDGMKKFMHFYPSPSFLDVLKMLKTTHKN